MAEYITIASRVPGFAWAGRSWETEPALVLVAEEPVDESDKADEERAEYRITAAQLAELERQCEYPRYPLRIGTADVNAQAVADARGRLETVRADIEAEQKKRADLRAERGKVDKALRNARKRLGDAEKELARTQDQLKAAELRAKAAEAQLTTVQVEPKPDPNRPRD